MADDSNEQTNDLVSPSSQPVGSSAVLATPKEPDPEPIAPVASIPEVVKEPMINVEEMLGNSSTIVPTSSPSLVVPNQTSPPPAYVKPKKKNMAGIIVGLMLFLGVVATGAYFVAKPESLADLRSLASCVTKEDCKTAKDLQEFYQGKNKEARERKEAEEPKEEKQPLNDYEKCRLESGTAKCNELFPQYKEIPGMSDKKEVPAEDGKCPPGSYTCGGGASMFCSTDQTKTCNQLIAERNPDATVQIGVVKCVQDKNKFWVADPLMEYNSNPTGVGSKNGKSVLSQVNEQCYNQMSKGGFATSGTTKKYICKVGVKNYTGGQCTENNGKVFTGSLGCFCGTVQVDTNAGHESYTSDCGCDKNEPASELTSASVLEPTPTTATTTSPICTNIKVYKGTEQVTPSTLLPEDAVTIAVVGTGNPTQARFRVNGAQITGDTDADPNWTISTTKNTSGEYFVSYTIPIGVTSFLFEGETFAAGEWH